MQPFHTVPTTGDPEPRRMLLLSWHFPPAESAGALRWQRLARYGSDRGWALDVVTLDPDALASRDPRRLEELPPGTRLYGVAPREPLLDRVVDSLWATVRRRVRGGGRNGGEAGPAASFPEAAPTPSARPESLGREAMDRTPRTRRDLVRAYHAWREYARDGAWARRASAVGRALAEERRYDAIVSCGPPHMAHVGAWRLSRRTGAPLVVDMRDPWSLVQRLPESVASRTWLALARRHEERVIRDAALVVANTEPARDALRDLYPDAAERIIAVLNGYDDDPLPTVPKRDRFTMAYAGTIYLDRDPAVLFRAASRVIEELDLGPDELGIELMGHVRSFNGLPVERIAESHGLDGYLHIHAPGPRSEAMELLASATLLVSLPQDSDLAIPSKVYEYLRHDAWVLALAHPDSATGRLLAGTDADAIDPDDLDAITAALRRRVVAYMDGRRPEPLATDRRLSRAHQASILFDAIEKRLGATAAAPAAGS